jgi:hypothetical protein
MPTTKPLPNHDLEPLMMPTNSSFFRTLETSRSLSMITPPGTTLRRSPFGRAIYTPNSSRDVILPLPPETRARLAGKRVRITYVSTDGGEPALAGSVLASLTATL